jgi:choline dehydrogenase-like flavoprotein
MQSRYGISINWPITYADVEPWYSQAEQELGVSGDSSQDLGSPRTRPYPLPRVPQTYLDKQWEAAAATIGLRVESTPQARNSQNYDGRPACCGSSSCIPLCPIGAKYDGAVHIRKARKAGAQVLDQAVVNFIEVDHAGRIVAVRYKRPDRTEHRVTGRVFVIAAHAIETPKLLLMSTSETTPNGVANSSDLVGRNLMDHPIQLSWALSRDPTYPYRGPMSTSGIEQLRDGDFRRERSAFRIEIGNTGWSWPVADPTGEVGGWIKQGLRGKMLIRKLNYHVAREVRLASLIEQQPDPENRITPAYDYLDEIGLPRPRIRYRLDEFARRGLAEAIKTHDQLFDALGVTDRQHWNGFQGAGHVMGTYRMGHDPRTSVVDRDCRAHDHPNLFLLGSGVFPTVGTANPTLTIAAFALRAAEPVIQTLTS